MRRIGSKRDSGSVSVYFIAITAAFVLLTGLLIDFARVAAFRKQAELAVKSGVRSVLSSFDPVLYARYGLWIRGGEDANTIFRETLQGNASSSSDGALKYLDTRWEQADVTESRPLADYGVFRRQVLEEMKYKAPIDLSIEVASRFRGVAGAMKEAGATVDLLERMRQAYEWREAALDGALDNQGRYGATVQRVLESEAASSAGSTSAGTVKNAAEAAGQYEDYVSKRLEDEARRRAIEEAARNAEEEEKREEGENGKGGKNGADSAGGKGKTELEKPANEAAVAAYEASVSALASAMAGKTAQARTLAAQAYSVAHGYLQEALRANEEMAAITEEAKKEMPATSEASGEGNGDVSRSLEEIRSTTDELLLEASFFDRFESEIADQRAKADALAEAASRFSSLAAAAPGSTGLGAELGEGADGLRRTFAAYADAYGTNGSVLAERRTLLAANRTQDEERKRQEEEARAEWSGATRLIGALAGKPGTEEEREAFGKLRERYESNLQWNDGQAELKEEGLSADPSEGRDQAMAGASDTLGLLQGAVRGTRDQLYYSEYVFERFTRYEPSYVKELLSGGEAPLSPGLQETEFVLYGKNDPAGNIAAAYGEIFAFRLAIRTMEGLVECRAMGHPLLVLAAALVYGIRNAVLDMNGLIGHGTVTLSKWVKAETRYEDYLRLFMLVHGGSANQTSRMIAVMETGSGVSFQGAYTYASGEGTASVRLWFFPGLLRALGRTGSLGGTVKDGRYEAAYAADSSYQ